MTPRQLAFRFFFSRKGFLNLTSSFGVVGLALGVASLVVAMAVVSGFVSTLRNSVIDVSGDIVVYRHGLLDIDASPADEILDGLVPKPFKSAPFLMIEGLIAHKGKVSGVLLEGLGESAFKGVLDYQSRVVEGKLDLSGDEDGAVPAAVGKTLAEEYGLKIGDIFRIVIPDSKTDQGDSLRPRLGKFKVVAKLELGRFDYNRRYVMAPIEGVQAFSQSEGKASGFRLRLQDSEQAQKIAFVINRDVGGSFWARSWVDANRNLFEAAQLEKLIIFVILLLIVIAGAFNVASGLYIHVLKRYPDISLLKAMGYTNRQVVKVFALQGFFVGVLGCLLGLLLGLGFCAAFVVIQDVFQLLPADMYTIDKVQVELNLLDLLMVFIVSLLICVFSTLAPALRAARLVAAEGLRYE